MLTTNKYRGHLLQLQRSGTILLLFHQTKHAKSVIKFARKEVQGHEMHFKKSENGGLHDEGSANVGGGCLGTRNKTFMG